jgi:Berberine and berberine like
VAVAGVDAGPVRHRWRSRGGACTAGRPVAPVRPEFRIVWESAADAEHGTIIGGPVFYDLADTAEVMRWYRDLMPFLPEELSGWIALLTIPRPRRSPRSCGAVRRAASCGAIRVRTRGPMRSWPVRTFGSPLLDGLQPMPFTVLQSAFDALYPAGLQWYWKTDFFRQISDEAIDVHARYGAHLSTGHSTMHLYPVDGAASRVGNDETAWAYRDARWGQVIVGVDPDPASAPALRQWTIDYHEALHPHSMGGAYVNMMMEEGPDRVRATYGKHYERLAEIKRKYDPTNLFHVNQNIPPAGQAGA